MYPNEYLNLLVIEGLVLKPDLVIISFFVGNDFANGADSWLRNKLYEYSFLTSFIHYLVQVQPHFEGRDAYETFDGEYCDNTPTFSEEAFLEIERGRSYICRAENRRLISELDTTISVLKEIQSICYRRSIDIFVLIIPDEMQVNRNLQNMIIAGSSEETKWDWSQPTRKLAERLEGLDIKYLDLYASFENTSRLNNLYRPRDTHWNIAGNELAAKLIYQELIEAQVFLN